MSSKFISNLTRKQKSELIRVCEDLFERYRYFKVVEAEHKVTGDESAYEKEQADSREQLILRIERFIERLPITEIQLIRLKYMGLEEAYDYQVYQVEMGISEGTFKKIRDAAFFKLAGAFKLDFGADPVEVPNIW